MKTSKLSSHNLIVPLQEGMNICAYGTLWIKNGVPHREDGPAIVNLDGSCEWFLNGLLHRENGPALIQSDGRKEWVQYGMRHRDRGPAVELPDGTKAWFQEGQIHRAEGPAVIYPDGRREWFLRDCELSEDEFNRWLEKKSLNEKLSSELTQKTRTKRSKL